MVERYDGHVAKYMGDGVLAYFGYPQAHEEDPERAVRAALDLVQAVHELTPRPELALRGRHRHRARRGRRSDRGGRRQGAGGGRQHAEPAARLQELAQPGEVMISATRRLVGNLFECEDREGQQLKGFAEPVRISPGAGLRTVDRFAALHTSLGPLIGREQESALLIERWRRATEGEGHVVVLSGEPGLASRASCSRFRSSSPERITAWCAISACRITATAGSRR